MPATLPADLSHPAQTEPKPAAAGASANVSVSTASIACLALAAFGSGVQLRVTDALLPRLASEFSISLGLASQVVSMFAVAYGCAQLFFGPAGDRFGKYRVIAWGCVACAVSAGLCGLAPNFDVLRIARMLAGATAAAIIPLAMAWIGDVVPYQKRQPVLARFLIGQILGQSAGVWLGGLAADHLGWRTPFFMLAALFAFASTLLFALHRRLPPQARAMRAGEGSAVRRIVSDFGHVLAGRWARVVLATVFLEGMLLYGPFAFIAAHLHERFGLSLATAGSVLMLFGIGGFVFALSAHRLAARLGESGLARSGGALMAASLALVAFGPAWWLAVPGCFATGIGFYMLHNTLQLNATQMTPDRRGAAVSAFAAAFFLGQSAGVGAAGVAVGHASIALVIGAGAVGVLAVGLIFARLRAAHRVAAAAS